MIVIRSGSRFIFPPGNHQWFNREFELWPALIFTNILKYISPMKRLMNPFTCEYTILKYLMVLEVLSMPRRY
jgi:hypothetical protein